jgi:saccharopine dehydrogenase (NAD+, L-lysine-forming)
MWQNSKNPKLKIIGDISCDIRGAVECTIKACDSSSPLYVYHPDTDSMTYGVEGCGPVIMAVDILPSEIPRESSEYFSNVLKQFVPALVNADYSASFENLNLPQELKRAVVLFHGKFTPEYEYIQKFIQS